MQRATVILRKMLLYVSALVLVAGYPTTAMATTQEEVGEVTATIEAPVSTESEQTTAPTEETLPPTYTFDPETEKWNSEEWEFNPESGAYEAPLQPIVIEPERTEDEPALSKDVDSSVTIDNDIVSDAVSGDATVSSNTTAGGARSGDALASATIINSINSSVAAGENEKIATFTKDIVGDVKGDIILYPLLLKAMLEQEAQQSGIEINASTDFDVNNNVTVNAESGDATVSGNTTAGDAETGTATAMANVVTILNSLIATQESFIGTINIYGSLEGDILIAPDFIPQMLASNGGGSGDMQLSTQDTTTIVNNISAVAESGAASVFGNTNGGSASTGDALSNVVIFNVTGHDIIAENSMLVFVNVLGQWVGMIVDAPAGATAAMIGNGVVQSNQVSPDITVTAQSAHGITNTIAVNATSGDALVSNNTTGGNATSGNTMAAANVANISGSQLSLSGWFGILFINVMGDWFGNFAVDTPFGNTPQSPVLTPAGPVQFVPEEQSRQSVQPAAQRTIIDSRFAQLAVVENVQDEPVESAVFETDIPETMGVSDSAPDAESLPSTPSNHLFWIVAGGIVVAGTSIAWVRRIF